MSTAVMSDDTGHWSGSCGGGWSKTSGNTRWRWPSTTTLCWWQCRQRCHLVWETWRWKQSQNNTKYCHKADRYIPCSRQQLLHWQLDQEAVDTSPVDALALESSVASDVGERCSHRLPLEDMPICGHTWNCRQILHTSIATLFSLVLITVLLS